MESITQAVERHYGTGRIMENIMSAMRQTGKDMARLTPVDLAPVDQFHVRGREGTMELAALTEITPGTRVLDVGCGIGGPSRYLAYELKCKVTGIDLTPEFVDVASKLSHMVGLDGSIDFRQASALELPFADNSFEVVWTQHVQMNIADKKRFYAEMVRVLMPGGRLMFHDIFQGPGGDAYYPAPWATDKSISALTTPQQVHDMLDDLGMRPLVWNDTTQTSAVWMEEMGRKASTDGPLPGLNVLMGESTRVRLSNVMRGLKEDRLVIIQAVWQK